MYLYDTNKRIFPTYNFKVQSHPEMGFYLTSNIYINLSEPIKLLEVKFCLRLCHLYKYLEKKDFNITYLLKGLEEFSNFIVFLKIFFYNYELEEKILTESVIDYSKKKYDSNDSDLNLRANIMSTKFNQFFEEYSLSISKLVTNEHNPYFANSFHRYFPNNDPEISKCKILTWLVDLIKDKNNIIILLLFPEIKFFIEFIATARFLRGKTIKIHIFFSYLIFKLQILKAKIKDEFLLNQNEYGFLFIHSNHINYLFLEIRMFIAHFRFNLMKEKNVFKVLVYKAFINFLRLKAPEVFQTLLYNEFSSINKCTIYSINQKITLNFKSLYQQNEISCKNGIFDHYEIMSITNLFLDYKTLCSGKNDNRVSCHSRNCPLFKRRRFLKYDEITLLNNENIKKIHDELKNFVFSN